MLGSLSDCNPQNLQYCLVRWKQLPRLDHVFLLIKFSKDSENMVMIIQNCWNHKRLNYCTWLNPVQTFNICKSCLTLHNPMNCSTPGLPVHHQLQKFTQTHVHWLSDAIQPSHPLSSPSPPAPNPSQHQGLFQRVNCSHEVAKVLGVSASTSVLPMKSQGWSPLEWTGWISLQSKGLSRVFSNTTVQKHQFFGAQLSL